MDPGNFPANGFYAPGDYLTVFEFTVNLELCCLTLRDFVCSVRQTDAFRLIARLPATVYKIASPLPMLATVWVAASPNSSSS